MKTIRFNVSAKRYINEKGQFIKESFVLESLSGYRVQISSRVRKKFDDYESSENKNLDALLKEVSGEIKQSTLTNYIVGRGGIKQLTPADINNMETILKKELTTTFTDTGTYGLQEIFSAYENGEISFAQLRARSLTYVNGSRKAYYAANAELNDKPYMQRELHGDNNCNSCISYANAGAVKAGDLPLPGEACECRSNCNCTVTYLSERQYKQWVNNQVSNLTDTVFSGLKVV
jgi:hypothetical protein